MDGAAWNSRRHVELFRPAPVEELRFLPQSGDPPDRAIAIRIDQGLAQSGREAVTAWFWGAAGYFYSGIVFFRTSYSLQLDNLVAA